MFKAVVLAAAIATLGSPATHSLPWGNWYELKNEISFGGHDGECPGVGNVMAFSVTRGEAGPDFRMWSILTPASNPSRWVAAELVGTYAEPAWTFTGSSGKDNSIIVESVRPYDPNRDSNLCDLLK